MIKGEDIRGGFIMRVPNIDDDEKESFPVSRRSIPTGIPIGERQDSSTIAKVQGLSSHFPNLVWESLHAGILKERHINGQIHKMLSEAEEMQKTLDLLLKLKPHIKEGKELSLEAKNLLETLKERGITLLGEGEKLTKEKVSDTKSSMEALSSDLRSRLNSIFTTKIQPLTQQINSIMDVLRKMIEQQNNLFANIQRRTGI